MGRSLDWLGTPLLSWLDVATVIRGATRTSAIGRDTLGEESAWSVTDHLLALVIDATQQTNYLMQKQLNPKSFVPVPRPVSRPGVKEKGTRLGSDPIPISQFEEWWSQAA